MAFRTIPWALMVFARTRVVRLDIVCSTQDHRLCAMASYAPWMAASQLACLSPAAKVLLSSIFNCFSLLQFISGCANCATGVKQCSSCLPGLSLYSPPLGSQECILQCPQGYFSLLGQCTGTSFSRELLLAWLYLFFLRL